ncbi:hypothetical protein BAY59_10015 [Prauserella coralliicola]|nr:hypothetical protein BAY59_10015 [Prauserella coralliicola]
MTDLDPALPQNRRAVIRITAASSIGTVVEWYDFALYGAASALIFAPLFFPSGNAVAGVLASFAVFAVGFAARPLGGLLAAHFGDRYGRKPILIATICLMGGATMVIGLLPTYDTAGIWAPILLTVTRLLQGLGAGAEFAGAVTAVSEFTPPGRRAFFTSISQAAVALSFILSTGTFVVLSLIPVETLHAWAWRVPFLASAVIFLVALYIRRRVQETPAFKAAKRAAERHGASEKLPITQVLRERPRALLVGIVSGFGLVNAGYLVNTFALSYITDTLELPALTATVSLLVAAGLSLITIPLFGALADRIGRRPVYIGGAVFAAAFAAPFFMLLGTRTPAFVIVSMTVAYSVGYGAMAGAQSAFLTELFPTRYRFTGVAAARETTAMLLGGTTPFIAAALVSAADGQATLVIIFVIACQALTVLALLCAPRPAPDATSEITSPDRAADSTAPGQSRNDSDPVGSGG